VYRNRQPIRQKFELSENAGVLQNLGGMVPKHTAVASWNEEIQQDKRDARDAADGARESCIRVLLLFSRC